MGPLLRDNYTPETKLTKYRIIPEEKNIRFRNTKERFQGYLTWLPELEKLKDQTNHYLNDEVTRIYPTPTQLELIRDVHEFSAQIVNYVDYFESNNNYQVIDRSKNNCPKSKFLFSVSMLLMLILILCNMPQQSKIHGPTNEKAYALALWIASLNKYLEVP